MKILKSRWFICLFIIAVIFVVYYFQFPSKIPSTNYKVHPVNYQYENKQAMDTGAFYGQSPWSAAHRDSRNSDFIPLPSPNSVKRTWVGIEHGNFFMGPTIGVDGNVYATSAGGVGHSHLHAYDNAGNLLWKTKPMKTIDDFDSAAFLSAPVIDVDNNLFIADKNQLWSFTNKGEVRWVTDLVAQGIKGYVFSVYFTHEGFAGIISSDGKVALFNRDNGQLAMDILELPGVTGMPASPIPPGLWEDGLVDPDILQDSWNAIFGFNMEVANTPSVHPTTGRIFIVATGRKPNEVVLYGIDVKNGKISIAFETLLGKSGSGTSPTLSFDGRFVYVVGGKGRLMGIDSNTGKVKWQAKETSVTGVSSTTTPDGKVFTFDLNRLICWDGSNGKILWQHNMSEKIEELGIADELPMTAKLYGDLNADIVSGIMAAADGIWFIMTAGIAIPLSEEQQKQVQSPIEGLPLDNFKQPINYYLMHYDYEGNFVSRAPFVDTGALLAMGYDGRIYASTLSVSSSIAHYGAGSKMPFFMRNTPVPHGSLIAYEPESFLDYFKEIIEWNILKIDSVVNIQNFMQGKHLLHLEQLNGSLPTAHISLIEAHKNNEISDEKFNELKADLDALFPFTPNQLGVIYPQLQAILTKI